MKPDRDIAWTSIWDKPEKPSRDLFSSRALENAGDRFQSEAIACICREWGGKQGTTKQFRECCEAIGIKPHHPSAWGGLTRLMKQSGLLMPVDLNNHLKQKRYHVLVSPGQCNQS
jgi:hypothetical protein